MPILSKNLLKRAVKIGTLADVMARFDKGEGLDCGALCRAQETLYFLPSFVQPRRTREVARKTNNSNCQIDEGSHHCGCTDYKMDNRTMVRYPCSPEHDLHVARPAQTEGRVMAGFFS